MRVAADVSVLRDWSTLWVDITKIANGRACRPGAGKGRHLISGVFFESAVLRDAYKPPNMDTSAAHQARVYDYLLGGKDNFADGFPLAAVLAAAQFASR